jgi:uncharacterized transporter YbjL
MANPWLFMVGLIWIFIGTVGLIEGRGYIFGQPKEGWPIRLIALIVLLAGVAIAGMGGLWGII